MGSTFGDQPNTTPFPDGSGTIGDQPNTKLYKPGQTIGDTPDTEPWPPGGTPPVTVVANPIGEYYQGNSRYTQTQDHSQTKFVTLSSSMYTDIPALKAANPAMKVLIYVTAADMVDLGIGATVPTLTQNRISNYGSVTYNEALSHDQGAGPSDQWVLRDSGGVAIQMYGYGAYIGDIGLASFRTRLKAIVLDKCLTLGFDGVEIDNLLAMGFAPYPAKYPDDPSWEEAMFAFIADVGPYLRSQGLFVHANCTKLIYDPKPGSAFTNDGTNHVNWWKRCAPYVDALMHEYDVQDPTNLAHARLSGSGNNGNDNWDGWAREYAAVQDLGAGWCSHTVSGGLEVAKYARATGLLFWDGNDKSWFVWNNEGGNQIDPRVHVNIGVGLGAKTVPQPNLHQRLFTNGLVFLNSDPALTRTISSFPDQRVYTFGDGTPAVLPLTLGPGRAFILHTGTTTPTPPPPGGGASSIGRTTIGTQWFFENDGLLAVHKYTMPEAGDISKLVAYVRGTAGGADQVLKPVIYADGAGIPTTRLAVGPQVTVVAGRTEGWQDWPLTAPVTVPAGPVWIGYHAGPNNGTIEIAKDTTGGTRRYKLGVTYGSGEPDPYGTTSVNDDAAYPSIYASYTPTASGNRVGTSSILSVWSPALNADEKRAVKVTMPSAGTIQKLTAYLRGGQGTGSGIAGRNTLGSEEFFYTFADSLEVQKVTAPSAITVSKLTMRLQNPGASAQVLKPLIYSDNGGVPGTLLGVGPAITLAAGAAAAWVDAVFSSGVAVPAGPFWIGFHGGPTDLMGQIARLTTDDSAQLWMFAGGWSYAAGPPSSWGIGGSSVTRSYAIYATYTASTAAGQVIKGIVYADASGLPTTKLGEGTAVTVAAAQAAGWVDLPFAAGVAVPSAGDIWIGTITGAAGNNIQTATELTGGASYRNTDTYADGASDPFGSGTAGAERRSIYATYV